MFPSCQSVECQGLLPVLLFTLLGRILQSEESFGTSTDKRQPQVPMTAVFHLISLPSSVVVDNSHTSNY